MRKSLMSSELARKISLAIEKLEAALNAATGSAGISLEHDEHLSARIDAYREVVRRQKILAGDLHRAVVRRDAPEATRIGQLIEKSSMLMKMDLEHIVSSIKILKHGQLRSAA